MTSLKTCQRQSNLSPEGLSGIPQEPLEIPKPETPAKLSVLAFSDQAGYCKNFFANTPEGRISMKKVVENYHTLTQEDVKKLVNEPKKLGSLLDGRVAVLGSSFAKRLLLLV